MPCTRVETLLTRIGASLEHAVQVPAEKDDWKPDRAEREVSNGTPGRTFASQPNRPAIRKSGTPMRRHRDRESDRGRSERGNAHTAGAGKLDVGDTNAEVEDQNEDSLHQRDHRDHSLAGSSEKSCGNRRGADRQKEHDHLGCESRDDLAREAPIDEHAATHETRMATETADHERRALCTTRATDVAAPQTETKLRAARSSPAVTRKGHADLSGTLGRPSRDASSKRRAAGGGVRFTFFRSFPRSPSGSSRKIGRASIRG